MNLYTITTEIFSEVVGVSVPLDIVADFPIVDVLSGEINWEQDWEY